jgi:hypothetical protein
VFTSLRAQHGRGEAQNRALPSFFIVGPPRTGTSYLHEILVPSALLPLPTNLRKRDFLISIFAGD